MNTRRAFLRTALSTTGLLLISACTGSQPSAAPTTAPAAPKPTAAPTTAPAASPQAVPAQASPAAKTGVALLSLDQELAHPASVLDAAKREGKLSWTSSIDLEPAKIVTDAFAKRYPEIKAEYQEASEEVRTVRTLTEFKSGRTRLDVVMGVGGFMAEYKDAGALTPLTDLPAVKGYESPYRDGDFLWAGVRTQNWGIGYNTEKVKEAELPKSWEELGDAKWKGRLGLGDRPQLWVQQLWKTWGPERTTAFLKALFGTGPQRRKEGLDASANLLGAGEFDIYIPSAPYRIQGLKEKGVPVGWHSPEPLTVAVSEMIIVQRSPSPNAAKVFVNWFASREGQATYSKADNAVPAHPALRADKEYLGMFGDKLVGRPQAIREPEDETRYLPEVRKVWQSFWTA